MSVQAAFDFVQRPVKAKKPERLFFALMPDATSAVLIAEAMERVLFANGLEANRFKPVVVLHGLLESKTPVLFGAKLAGQAVAAAGLVLTFDTIATVGARWLTLSGSDTGLAAVQEDLAAALRRNGLNGEAGPPLLSLAHVAARVAPSSIPPVPVRVTGLALLRGEPEAFQVLRRWPLNRGA